METREVSCCSVADQLSLLPDDILHHILSFIPETKEIARTSVLSTRFRRLWHHHPTIRFDTPIRLDESNPSYDLAAARYFLSVLSCLLFSLSPTLQTLDLRLLSHFPYCTKYATQFVRFAASRSVRSLRLCSYSSRTTKIPAAVYSCRMLTSLELEGKIPNCPDSFTGFPFLLRLQIWGPISSQTLARILSRCPSLRRLTLSCSHSLDISSETLSEVSITCSRDIQSIRLDVPNLVSISFLMGMMDALRIVNARHLLDARMMVFKATPVAPSGLIEDLRHVSRRLEVDDWLFGFSLPRSPNPKFKNLKELHCCLFNWITAPMLRGLVSVLWHCPNLEQFYVDLSVGFRFDILRHNRKLDCIKGTEEEYRPSPGYLDEYQKELADDREREVWDPSEAMEGFEEWRHSRLKFVVVDCFLGTANEMKMLEYLLSRGSALEKLTIRDCLMRGQEEIHQLLAHIP